MATKTKIFNQDKYENFIEDKISEWINSLNFSYFAIYQQKNVQQYMYQLILFNDNSKFLNSPDKYSITSHSKCLMTNIPDFKIALKENTTDRYFLISTYFGNNYSEINRVYLKIDEVIARILTIISVLLLILRMINNYISEYLFTLQFKEPFIKYLDGTSLDYIQYLKKSKLC